MNDQVASCHLSKRLKETLVNITDYAKLWVKIPELEYILFIII